MAKNHSFSFREINRSSLDFEFFKDPGVEIDGGVVVVASVLLGGLETLVGVDLGRGLAMTAESVNLMTKRELKKSQKKLV